jgi:hypothetical protein
MDIQLIAKLHIDNFGNKIFNVLGNFLLSNN